MLKGEGETGYKGGPKGDLYITIHIKKHNIYTRKGNNVICEIPITFTGAALGTEIEVPMVDGSKEKFKIPKEEAALLMELCNRQNIPNLSFIIKDNTQVQEIFKT